MPDVSPPPLHGTRTASSATPMRLRLTGDLKAGGPLPGHDMRIIEGRNDDRVLFRRETRRDLLALVALAVIEDDLGPERARVLQLDAGCVGGHDDGGFDAEQARGGGDALRVIARGERDHAALPLGRRELHQPVVGAAKLE